MHSRHLALVAAILLPCVGPGAGAQVLRDQGTTGSPGPTYFVVNVQPGNFTLTANKIVWGAGPRAAELKGAARRGAALEALRARPGSRVASNSVELIWLTQPGDTLSPGWVHSQATQQPSDVTITAMSATGKPLVRYFLVGAIPTKYWLDRMDTGASHMALTHLTLTAQSVTVERSGS